ncbi:hypothetical protein ACFE04_017745 [Oxalis oulophora]
MFYLLQSLSVLDLLVLVFNHVECWFFWGESYSLRSHTVDSLDDAQQDISHFLSGWHWTCVVDGTIFFPDGKSGYGILFSGPDESFIQTLSGWLEEGRREKFSTPVASSPPYFCGSPPSRAPNPLIEDARFGDERIQPPCYSMGPPSPSSCVSGGCTRMKFGHTPAAVRIEGFDCLTRDRRIISAMA